MILLSLANREEVHLVLFFEYNSSVRVVGRNFTACRSKIASIVQFNNFDRARLGNMRCARNAVCC